MTVSEQQPIQDNNSEYLLDTTSKQTITGSNVSEISRSIVSQDASSSSLDSHTIVGGDKGEVVDMVDQVAVGKVKEKASKHVDENLKNKILEICGYWDEYVQKNSTKNPISFKELLSSNDTDSSYMTFFTGLYTLALEARHELYSHMVKAMIGKQKDVFQKLYITVMTRLPLIAHLLVEYRSLVTSKGKAYKLIRSSDDPNEKETILTALSEEISLVKKSLYTIQNRLKNYYKNDRKRFLGTVKASSKLLDVLQFIEILKDKQDLEFIFTNSGEIIDALPSHSIQTPQTCKEFINLSESMLDQLSGLLSEFAFFWKRDPRSSSKVGPICQAIDLIHSMKGEFENCRRTMDFDKFIDLQRKQEEFCGYPVHQVVMTLLVTAPSSIKAELSKIQNKYGLKEQKNLINRLLHHETMQDYYYRARFEFKLGMKEFVAERGAQIDLRRLVSIMQNSHDYAKDNFHVLGFIDKIGIFSNDKNYYNFVQNPCKKLHELSKEVFGGLTFIQNNPKTFQQAADCVMPLVNILSSLSFHILSSGPELVNNILKLRKNAKRMKNEGMDSKKIISIKTKHKVLSNLKGHFSKEQHIDCEFTDCDGIYMTNMMEKGLFDDYVEQHEKLLEENAFDGIKQTDFEKMFWKYVNENQLWSYEDLQYLLDMVVDMQLGALEIIKEVKSICSQPKQSEVIKEKSLPQSPAIVSEGTSQFTIQSLSDVLGVDKFFILEPVDEKPVSVLPPQKKPVELKGEKQQVESLEDIDEVPENLWKPEKWYKLRKILKILRKMGYEKLPSRRGRGSHIMMKDVDGNVVTIPRKLKKGTVHSILE